MHSQREVDSSDRTHATLASSSNVSSGYFAFDWSGSGPWEALPAAVTSRVVSWRGREVMVDLGRYFRSLRQVSNPHLAKTCLFFLERDDFETKFSPNTDNFISFWLIDSQIVTVNVPGEDGDSLWFR